MNSTVSIKSLRRHAERSRLGHSVLSREVTDAGGAARGGAGILREMKTNTSTSSVLLII